MISTARLELIPATTPILEAALAAGEALTFEPEPDEDEVEERKARARRAAAATLHDPSADADAGLEDEDATGRRDDI